jgi:hypothetical protein
MRRVGEQAHCQEIGVTKNTGRRYLRAGGHLPYGRRQWRQRQLAGLEEWLCDKFHRHRGNADVVRQQLECCTAFSYACAPSSARFRKNGAGCERRPLATNDLRRWQAATLVAAGGGQVESCFRTFREGSIRWLRRSVAPDPTADSPTATDGALCGSVTSLTRAGG